MVRDISPAHSSPLQWTQAMGVARDVCARIFRDGGQPADALAAFGLDQADRPSDWNLAVERMATALCAQPQRRAA